MTARIHREEGASAPSDPRSIAALAADYRAAFARWGHLLDRQEEAEARLWSLRKRGNVVFLRDPREVREAQLAVTRAEEASHAMRDVCGEIEQRAARIVPEDMTELRESAALFTRINEGLSGELSEGTHEAWCQSLAAGIARLRP